MSEQFPGRPAPKQFRGRDFMIPGEAPRQAASPAGVMPPPGESDSAFGAPRGLRPKTEREKLFERYADLRGKLAEAPRDVALLVEAASVAEDLSLTIEAIELWREVLNVDRSHADATKRLAFLDRRAAATGETGAARAPAHRVREQPAEAAPFWTRIPSVLAYPFRGRGLGVFVGASIFFAVGEVVATFNVFFGWFVMLCLLGYLAAWQFDVISRTAAGKDDPPEFPEVVTIIDSCVLPFLGFLGCYVFAYAPMILVGALTIQGTLPPVVGLVAVAVLFIPCGFVFPMTLTVRALTQSIGETMNPARVYGSILRILPDYLLAFLSLCILWGAWSVVRVGVLVGIGIVFGLPTADAILRLDFLRITGWFLYTAAVWPLLLYVWCVQGHVLGCVYRQSYKRLAWFVNPGTETAKAKQMSFAVVLAGVAGAAILGGAGLLTWAMWPGARANALLGGGECPIPAGAELTYYWESTDGPCGDATYKFDGMIDGKLGVHAWYRLAGEFGVNRTDSPTALIDKTTGIVLRGDGEEGGLRLCEKGGLHTRFFGPKRSGVSSTYLNDWSVRAETRWKDTWDTWRVVDAESGTELYYDKATGILVGRRFPGVGYNVVEWLTSAKGVPGIGRCPGPNRTLDAMPGEEFDLGLTLPEAPPQAPDMGFDPDDR